MQSLERRALYNLIRMNWLNTPSLRVENWQIEDYQALSTDHLLARLEKEEISFDKQGFITFSQDFSSPEDLTDNLVADRELRAAKEDEIYLLIFELWRRFLPDQPSVSILCDNLDRQIFLYDKNPEEYEATCESALERFIDLLKENADQGLDPENVFELISNYFANDLETFLYDFVTEKIENESNYYTEDLIESLTPYVSDKKWFLLLRFRFYGSLNTQIGRKLFDQISDEYLNEKDLSFNLELLSILSQTGEHPVFNEIFTETLPLIEVEEDFQDLLDITEEYFEILDQKEKSKLITSIKKERSSRRLDSPVKTKDADIEKLRHLVKPQ